MNPYSKPPIPLVQTHSINYAFPAFQLKISGLHELISILLIFKRKLVKSLSSRGTTCFQRIHPNIKHVDSSAPVVTVILSADTSIYGDLCNNVIVETLTLACVSSSASSDFASLPPA